MSANRTIGRTILILALLLSIMVCIGAAGTGGGIELSPPAVELVVEPGAERAFEIMLSNKSDSEAVRVRVTLAPVVQTRNGGYELAQEATKWSAVSWLSLKSDLVVLKPKDTELITIKAKVPRGAAGSRVAAVAFEILPAASGGRPEDIGGSVAFVHRMTTIVKITARNRVNRLDATVSALTVIYPLAKLTGQFGPDALAVVCAVANEGDTLFNGQGRLIIRNDKGRRVKEAPLGAGKGTVLPGATVEFVSVFPEGLPDGDYTAEVVINYGLSRPLQAKVPFAIAKGGTTTAGRAEVAKGIRLAVTPELIETSMPQGAFRGFSLTLANQEDGPVDVRLGVRGLNTTPEGGLVAADKNEGEWSAAGWVRLGEDSLTLKPGEKKIVQVTVTVPKETPDGTHYALLLCETSRADGKKTGATTEIGTPLAVNVGKTLIRKAAITRTWLEQPNNPGPLYLCVDLVNKGTTHLKPTGKLVLYKRADAPKTEGGLEYIGEGRFEEFETIPLQEYAGWVLPGASLVISVPYPKQLAPGEYQAELVVEFGEKLPVKGSVRFRVAAQKRE